MTGERDSKQIRVEVAYALPDQQVLLELEVKEGTTIQQAIECSGILGRIPGLELRKERVGVFGKLAQLDTVLRDGDRVEIYRPLVVDPKEAHRGRAQRSSRRVRRS